MVINTGKRGNRKKFMNMIINCLKREGSLTNKRISQQIRIDQRYVVKLTQEMYETGILHRFLKDKIIPVSKKNPYYFEIENENWWMHDENE